MKETIVTIPINDLFAPKCGCPLCRMEEMLEEQYVTFITGDAMMEPSVRVATNKKGFCHRHFSRMTQLGQKLPNALILETHLEVVRDELLPKKAGGKPDKKKLEAIRQTLNSCYVCDRIEADMFHLVATVFTEWAKGGEFRKTYNDQPFICLKHYQFIMTGFGIRRHQAFCLDVRLPQPQQGLGHLDRRYRAQHRVFDGREAGCCGKIRVKIQSARARRRRRLTG